MPTTPPLTPSRSPADLPVERRDRCGAHDHAALAGCVRHRLRHRVGRRTAAERADQVYVDDADEALQVVRRLLAERALGDRDTRTVHEDVQPAELLQRELHGGLAVGLARHVGLDEAPAEVLCKLLADLGLHVGDHDFRAAFGRHACGSRAEAGCAASDEEYAISDLHR
jgi:hypothetical protein